MPMSTELHTSIWRLVDYKLIPRVSCVYKITHENSEMEYIGRSVDLRDRARKHENEFRNGTHKNPKMLNCYNKHGDAFFIQVIFQGSVEECSDMEAKLLADIDLKSSFNCHRNSNGGWLGFRFSDEARTKLSEMRKGKVFAEESKARQKETRKTSESWKAHQDYLQTQEAIERRCKLAATPEARAKAVATRRKNYGNDFFAEPRKRQIEKARQNIFAALDWAVANNATRADAIKKFGSSWGSLKKFLPEWEEMNGKLGLPLRASGPRNGNYKG